MALAIGFVRKELLAQGVGFARGGVGQPDS